jgi:hypothetical protein
LIGVRSQKRKITIESKGTSNVPLNVQTPEAASSASLYGVSPADTIVKTTKSTGDTYIFSNAEVKDCHVKSSPVDPSQKEAVCALELVIDFFQSQDAGYVEPQEYITIGKLIKRFRIK